MSTHDAYVDAETVGISTDFSGIAEQINVAENQNVDNGQVLYRLDPRQFQIALDNARANLAQTALTIASMKQDYGRMLSDVAAQQAQVALDQAKYDRNASLVGGGAVSKATPTTRRVSRWKKQLSLPQAEAEHVIRWHRGATAHLTAVSSTQQVFPGSSGLRPHDCHAATRR